MTRPNSGVFVLITHYVPASGARKIVHAYGPYKTRAEAANAKKRVDRRYAWDVAEGLVPGDFTTHVSEVLTTDD